MVGLKACRALDLVSLHCALETKMGHSNKVTRDDIQRPKKTEVQPVKIIKSADQADISTQQHRSQSRSYIKPSVPISSRPRIKDKEHLMDVPRMF